MRTFFRRWMNAFDLLAEAMALGDAEARDGRLARLEEEVAALDARLARCGSAAADKGDRRLG